MSILDGLRAEVPDRSYALDELTGTQAYEWALDDVREALTNPTDEQVNAIAGAVRCICKPPPITDGPERECGIHGDMPHVVRAVLAAAAGGER